MYIISIIVPCFNSGGYIENLINNLKLQTLKNFEVIFVDDCSKDNTYELLQKITVDCGFRCKVIRNEQNLGPGISRNNGIDIAEGKYIMFVDSDDFIDKETIRLISESMVKNKYPDAILYDYYRTNGKNNIPCDSIPSVAEGDVSVSDALLYSKGSTWCKVYNREFIINKAVRFPKINTNEDFTFNKLALSYCKKIFYLKKNLYYYVYNPNSIVNSGKPTNDNSRVAFEILNREINQTYKSVVCFLKTSIYLYGSVQSMIRRDDAKKDIENFIDIFTLENSDWIESVRLYRVSKLKKYMFYLIRKKKLAQLSLIIKIQDAVKKIFMQ